MTTREMLEARAALWQREAKAKREEALQWARDYDSEAAHVAQAEAMIYERLAAQLERLARVAL